MDETDVELKKFLSEPNKLEEQLNIMLGINKQSLEDVLMQKFRLEELRVRVILIKNTFDNPNILTKDEFLAMVRPKDKEKLKESKEKITNDFNKSIKDAGIRFGGNLTRKLTISPISLLEPSISLEISESKNKNKKRT